MIRLAARARPRPSLLLTTRIVLAVFAGFGFVTALAALGAVGLPLAFGMAGSEAALLCSMLGFLVYLVVLLWSFAEPRLTRIGLVLVGGALAAYTLARALAPAGA